MKSLADATDEGYIYCRCGGAATAQRMAKLVPGLLESGSWVRNCSEARVAFVLTELLVVADGEILSMNDDGSPVQTEGVLRTAFPLHPFRSTQFLSRKTWFLR
jgi:hypothetical protein